MSHAIALYLAMGGYAQFVWPAYGVAIVVLGGLALLSWRRYRASRIALEAVQRADPDARAGPGPGTRPGTPAGVPGR